MQTNRLFVSVQRQVEERPPSADILAAGDSAAEFANGLSAFFAPRTQKLEKSVKETYSKQCPMLMEDFDIADGHEGGAEIYCTTRSQDCQELYEQANEQAIKQFGIANPTDHRLMATKGQVSDRKARTGCGKCIEFVVRESPCVRFFPPVLLNRRRPTS